MQLYYLESIKELQYVSTGYFNICTQTRVTNCESDQVANSYQINNQTIIICSQDPECTQFTVQNGQVPDCGTKYVQIVYQNDDPTQQTYQCLTQCSYFWFYYDQNQKYCTQNKDCSDVYDQNKLWLPYLKVKLSQCIPYCFNRTYQYDTKIVACSDTNDSCVNYDINNQLLQYYDVINNICIFKCQYNYFYNQFTTLQNYNQLYAVTGKDPRCTQQNSCQDAIDKNGEHLSLLMLPDHVCFSEYQNGYMRKLQYNDQTIGVVQRQSCYQAINEQLEKLLYYDSQKDLCVIRCEYNWYQHGKDVYYNTYSNYDYYCTLNDDCQDAVYNETGKSLSFLKVSDKQCIEECGTRTFIYSLDNNIIGCTLLSTTCKEAKNISGNEFNFYDTIKQQCVNECTYNWYQDPVNDQLCTQTQTCQNIVVNQIALKYFQQTNKQCVQECQIFWYKYETYQYYCTTTNDCSDPYCIQNQLNYLMLQSFECSSTPCQFLSFEYSSSTVGCTIQNSCQNAINKEGQLQRNYDQTYKICISVCQYYSYQYSTNNYYCTVNNNCNDIRNQYKVSLQYLNIETKTCVQSCQYRQFQYNQQIKACTNENLCSNAYNESNLIFQFYDTMSSQCVYQCQYFWYQYNSEKYCTNNNMCNIYDFYGHYLQYIYNDSQQCTDCTEEGYKPKDGYCIQGYLVDQKFQITLIVAISLTVFVIIVGICVTIYVCKCIKKRRNKIYDTDDENSNQCSYIKDVSLADFDKFCSTFDSHDNHEMIVAAQLSE